MRIVNQIKILHRPEILETLLDHRTEQPMAIDATLRLSIIFHLRRLAEKEKLLIDLQKGIDGFLKSGN